MNWSNEDFTTDKEQKVSWTSNSWLSLAIFERVTLGFSLTKSEP